VKLDGPDKNIFEVNDEFSISFRMESEFVEKFVDLTGDKSSLHTDHLFARKSIFRQKVVHGMLPVMFVSALPPCYNGPSKTAIQEISVRFLRPVFSGDSLCLKAKIVNIDGQGKSLHLEFSILKEGNDALLTTGHLFLNYQDIQIDKSDKFPTYHNDGRGSMILNSLEEKEVLLGQIEKGDAEDFGFVITDEHVKFLFSILENAHSNKPKFDFSEWNSRFHAENLLAASLLSTFVGMCLPGKYATFTDFSLDFKNNIQLNIKYLFHGEVGFKSETTSTLVENISICANESKEDMCVSGKANVKLNEPSPEMPSIEFLKKKSVNLDLKDKVVLITGASRGIGETTAKLFSLHGAKVMINYFQSREDAERVKEEIIKGGGEAETFRADVTDREKVKGMVASIITQFGGIDILVNNAAQDAYSESFLELSWEDIQGAMDVIIKGAFNCCHEVLSWMVKNNGGKIINLSTVFTDNPPPKFVKYVVAKAGLVGLTRSLAVEFAPHNIRVNMVAPSLVETDLTKHISKIYLSEMKANTPMERHATSVDVAQAIVLLASSMTPFTTGQKFMVTGGSPPFL
jgi:3-oxoacyl-[acyl-carrier protein] reductase